MLGVRLLRLMEQRVSLRNQNHWTFRWTAQNINVVTALAMVQDQVIDDVRVVGSFGCLLRRDKSKFPEIIDSPKAPRTDAVTRKDLRLALRAAGLSMNGSKNTLQERLAQHAAAAAAASVAAAAVAPDNGDGDDSGSGGGGGGNDENDHGDHAHDHDHDHHDDDHGDDDDDDGSSNNNDGEDEQVEEEVSTHNAQHTCVRAFLPSYTFAGARTWMHTRRRCLATHTYVLCCT